MSSVAALIVSAMAFGFLTGLTFSALIYGLWLAAVICALALVNVPGLVHAARRVR